jgi:hypothetical protein
MQENDPILDEEKIMNRAPEDDPPDDPQDDEPKKQ